MFKSRLMHNNLMVKRINRNGLLNNNHNYPCLKTNNHLSLNRPIHTLYLNSKSKLSNKNAIIFKSGSSKIWNVRIKSTNSCKSKFNNANLLFPSISMKSLNSLERKSMYFIFYFVEIRRIYIKRWKISWRFLKEKRAHWSKKVPKHIQDHAFLNGVRKHSEDHPENMQKTIRTWYFQRRRLLNLNSFKLKITHFNIYFQSLHFFGNSINLFTGIFR